MAIFKVTLAGRWSEDEGWVEMAGVDSLTGEGGSEESEIDEEEENVTDE